MKVEMGEMPIELGWQQIYELLISLIGLRNIHPTLCFMRVGNTDKATSRAKDGQEIERPK
jgi:hypothetical protein